jgi:hypothetical protein
VPQGTLRLTSIAVAAAALVLLPWMIRNEKAFGHLFFIRDNFGLELSVSNHEGAHPLFEQELSVSGAGTFEPRHPSKSVSEAQLVQRIGEVNYNHCRFEEASLWIRTHPRAFLWLTARRVWYFWFTPGLSYKTFVLFPLVAAALVGLVRLFRVSPLSGWLFAACWVMFPVVYYILLVESRYGYPLYQNFLFLASFAFFDAMKSFKKDLVNFG